jgi:hypothetical protein
MRKAVDSAYFALPPLAAFFVAFFLAIVPPFPKDGTLNARRRCCPQNLTGAIIRKFALIREPYHRLRADSHITLRAIALRRWQLPTHLHVSWLIQELT